jgi:DNA end-binding protein Ku
MPRALWKGAISFGLVHVPVDLYPAAQRHTLDLDWLDKRTLDPIGYKKINKSTGREVEAEQIVKGYQYQKGRYVVLGDEDFKQANPVATQTVEILAFIDAGEIPVEYYDTPYFLVPGRKGEKVYALLREAMKQAKRIAVARVVIQTKQHLAAVYPQDRILMLNTLRYADEIRDAAELSFPATGAKGAGVKDNELKMALRLIDEMAEEWKPEKYRDTYREDVLKRVKAKIKAGKTKEVAEPSEGEAPRQKAEVIDLVALLKQSVGKKPGEPRAQSAEVRSLSAAKSARSKRSAAKRATKVPAKRRRRA